MLVEDDSISSYNFPGNYFDEINKEHSIIVPPGMKLFMTFSKFNLEASDNCKYDFLKIFDISGHQLFFDCGTRPYINILFESEKYVTITFSTDHSITRSGFKLHYMLLNIVLILSYIHSFSEVNAYIYFLFLSIYCHFLYKLI